MGGGYGSASGTSLATPIAAGVGALVLSVKPSLSASGLVTLLQQNSDDLGAPGFDTSFGWGRVNAYKAVLAAQNAPTTDTTPTTVSVSSPSPGATSVGTIQVQGTASDNVGVTKVEYYLDSVLRSSSTGAAFSFPWNTAGVANGSHTITIKAYDAAGNVGSASETDTVNNPVTADTQ